MRAKFKNHRHLAIALFLFFIGCYLHFERGAYGIGIRSLSAQGVEDAYISYRYGWNLANHGILSWNETGYRRTEGFTNPLWVYTSALWALFSHKTWIYPLMALTSIVVTAGFLLILFIAVQKYNGGSRAAAIGLLLVAVTPAIWLHSTSGLESGIFGAGLATLAYISILALKFRKMNYLWIMVLAAALCLLRSDGFIYVAIIWVGTLVAGSPASKWVGVGLMGGVFVIFGWRYLTFGTYLPNTAIAKVNFSLQERLRFATITLLYIAMFSGITIYILYGLAGAKLETSRIFISFIIVISGWIIYYLYIGGDYLLERHLVSLYFLGAALSGPIWVGTKNPQRVVLVTLILIGLMISVFMETNRFQYWLPNNRDPWILLGQEMAINRDYYGVLVTSAAGKIPFYAGGDCIDAYGLNDPHLATLTRASFFPGHSAGSEEEAIKIALAHPSGKYSRFTRLDLTIISRPEDIALWINTHNPQPYVQHAASEDEWIHAINSGDPYIWSIITRPFQVFTP